jgi:general secretion pathway protein D
MLGLSLTGCQSGGSAPGGGPSPFGSIFSTDLSARSRPAPAGTAGTQQTEAGASGGEMVFLGSGGSRDGAGQTTSSYAPGEISLNFQNADLKEVVQAVLGNALKVNYTIDPTVSGTVTISSARPVGQDDLLPILEMVLQMNGAALMRDGELYRVVPEGSAVAQWGDVGDARAGYGISILPLRFVSAQTLISLIDGFGTRPGSVRAEAARNLLIVLGNSADREAAIETALSFDADWMQDQSVAVLPLRRAKPETVITELERIFKASQGGVGADLVQFMPMARMKAVLVVSPQRDILERARTWVQRLDNNNPDLEASVYVYRVKYRDAKKLADLLVQVFSSAPSAPGTAPTDQIEPEAQPVMSEGFTDPAAEDLTAGPEQQAQPDDNTFLAGSEPTTAEAPLLPGGIRIQADTSNNSVVIYADLETRQEILKALVQIDVPPLQVAINITMAEIRLTDQLRYGVQYFIRSGNASLGLFGTNANVIRPEVPGFNFVLGGGRSPSLIIDAFDAMTDVQVLSSPSLVVMENEVAKFQVGDQIPIVTRTVSDPGGDSGLVTSNEVEYRDTGIILNVKPRVAENGVVSMTIEQEISSVSAGSNSLTPVISNRRVSSSIAVEDGQTVLLGGLISEQSERGKSGIPGLHRMKGIGGLFGKTNTSSNRSELLILIRPSVIRNGQDAQQVAEELRSRLWAMGANQAR